MICRCGVPVANARGMAAHKRGALCQARRALLIMEDSGLVPALVISRVFGEKRRAKLVEELRVVVPSWAKVVRHDVRLVSVQKVESGKALVAVSGDRCAHVLFVEPWARMIVRVGARLTVSHGKPVVFAASNLGKVLAAAQALEEVRGVACGMAGLGWARPFRRYSRCWMARVSLRDATASMRGEQLPTEDVCPTCGSVVGLGRKWMLHRQGKECRHAAERCEVVGMGWRKVAYDQDDLGCGFLVMVPHRVCQSLSMEEAGVYAPACVCKVFEHVPQNFIVSARPQRKVGGSKRLARLHWVADVNLLLRAMGEDRRMRDAALSMLMLGAKLDAVLALVIG